MPPAKHAKFTAVYGNSQVAPPSPATNFGFTSNPFQLVSWKSEDGHGRRMLVTLNQVIKAGTVAPWQPTLNTTGTDPYLAPNAGAPLVRMQWGIGGARQQALFAYPISGMTFPVTADSLEIDVIHRAQISPGESLQYAASLLVGDAPAFGQPTTSAFSMSVNPAGTTQPYLIQGSFVRSILIENDVASTAMPVACAVEQFRVNNAGTPILLLKRTQVADALKANGQVEVLIDPWCALVRLLNNDPTQLWTCYVTEKLSFA